MNMNSPAGQTSSNPADNAPASVDAAMQSVRDKANDAMDGLSNTMQNVKDQAAQTLERFRPQLDSVAAYAKEEPAKALLIAAAAGAGLMGLIALMGRSSSTPSPRAARNAAYDTADDWRQAAADKADDWRKAAAQRADRLRKAGQDAADEASSRADSMLGSTKGAAKAAYEGLADTVQQWKDQAGPVVDRIRPQIEAVTGYAKDDPGKALLIAAAAGAALMGLMSSINR